jgi:8-oxo-dGTP pyrophosphatase MutT (NUDIX family)
VQKYTLGIAVTEDSVVLVKKNRPEWQAGKYNFVGGKVEPKETPLKCVVREFYEETGVKISDKNWRSVGYMYRPKQFQCYIYVTAHPLVPEVKTMTDEEIVTITYKKFFDEYFRDELISNLPTIFQFVMSDDFLLQRAKLIIKYP